MLRILFPLAFIRKKIFITEIQNTKALPFFSFGLAFIEAIFELNEMRVHRNTIFLFF